MTVHLCSIRSNPRGMYECACVLYVKNSVYKWVNNGVGFGLEIRERAAVECMLVYEGEMEGKREGEVERTAQNRHQRKAGEREHEIFWSGAKNTLNYSKQYVLFRAGLIRH